MRIDDTKFGVKGRNCPIGCFQENMPRVLSYASIARAKLQQYGNNYLANFGNETLKLRRKHNKDKMFNVMTLSLRWKVGRLQNDRVCKQLQTSTTKTEKLTPIHAFLTSFFRYHHGYLYKLQYTELDYTIWWFSFHVLFRRAGNLYFMAFHIQYHA